MESLPTLVDLAPKLQVAGAMGWQLQLTMPRGRAAGCADLALPPSAMSDVARTLRTLVERKGLRPFITDNIGYLTKDDPFLRTPPGVSSRCWLGCFAGIRAIGSIDELNSVIGLLLCEELPDQCREILIDIQHRLFDAGGELSMPGHELLERTDVDKLEQWLDSLNAKLEPLENFILPGGSRAASLCHVARSVARRAECDLVALGRAEEVSLPLIAFLNRLSDLLFVMARTLNRHAGTAEVLWKQKED